MIPAAWPAAIAHIDADCFYASCELLRRPELRGKPVCVLSSQDACIVAKTYDAKAAGINTGMAVWEARKKLPDAVYIPADFRFYGLVSHKMFAILRRFTPIVEQYSIDEAFADLYGLRSFWHLGYDGLADAIRGTVKREAGITVSIGVSVSRTLAKMASDANKPDGSKIVSGHDIGAFLQGQSVRDIPGIGDNRAALLAKFGIRSALDFSRAPESLIRRLLGRGGSDLWRELNGQRVFDIEHQPRLPKSMARTASLGLRTSDPRMVRAHLSRHCFRLGMDMLAQGIVARRFTVMLRLGSFERVYQAGHESTPAADDRQSAHHPAHRRRGARPTAENRHAGERLRHRRHGDRTGLQQTAGAVRRQGGREDAAAMAGRAHSTPAVRLPDPAPGPFSGGGATATSRALSLSAATCLLKRQAALATCCGWRINRTSGMVSSAITIMTRKSNR